MIVADTHAWLWWVNGSSNLPPAVRSLMDSEAVVVPAIVCWEVALLASAGRIELDGGARAWLTQALSWSGVQLAPLTAAVAAVAANLGPGFHRDPADRLIVATALELDAPLATRDERIQAYRGVRAIW